MYDKAEQSFIVTNTIITNTGALDFETTTFYKLDIVVRDGGSPVRSTSVQVTVSVSAVNEAGPVFAGAFSSSIAEDASIGDPVSTVTATDVDGDVHEHGRRVYSITGGDPDSQFTINPDTGLVTVAGEIYGVYLQKIAFH